MPYQSLRMKKSARLAGLVREIAEELRLSAEDLVCALSVACATLFDLPNEQVPVSRDTPLRIDKVLGVSTEALLRMLTDIDFEKSTS